LTVVEGLKMKGVQIEVSPEIKMIPFDGLL